MSQMISCDLSRGRPFFPGVAADAPTPSDFVLARAAAGGATAAIGELYVRHRRRVYSLCMRMTRNAADAEDLTQEVFVHILGKVGSFRGESQFTTWLHRLTVNQVLMRFRYDTRRRGKMPEYIEAHTSHVRDAKHPAPPPVIDQIALDVALSRLPPGYRSIFILHDIEGYSHEEVASMLGCSVGTSKSQLHKARTKLRRLLRSGKLERGETDYQRIAESSASPL